MPGEYIELVDVRSTRTQCPAVACHGYRVVRRSISQRDVIATQNAHARGGCTCAAATFVLENRWIPSIRVEAVRVVQVGFKAVEWFALYYRQYSSLFLFPFVPCRPPLLLPRPIYLFGDLTRFRPTRRARIFVGRNFATLRAKLKAHRDVNLRTFGRDRCSGTLSYAFLDENNKERRSLKILLRCYLVYVTSRISRAICFPRAWMRILQLKSAPVIFR